MLARQLGGVLAGIHGLPRRKLPELRRMTAATRKSPSSSGTIAASIGRGRCSNWRCAGCATTIPARPSEVTLVHGDFRHGNLIIGPDGVRAVLDWELAHLGDPMEDLGWICVNSWRFGEIDKPVGGFGTREELFAGYEAAGRSVDPDARQVLGSDGHAALGHHVLRHDAALSRRAPIIRWNAP